MCLKIRYLFCFLILVISVHYSKTGVGQIRLPDRKITIHSRNESIESVLRKIEQAGKVNFSYNSDILNGDSLVSVSVENQSVEKTLSAILGKGYYFKSTASHIIILQRDNMRETNPKKEPISLPGLVFDLRTQKAIPLATVYDMASLRSVLSDKTGKFLLRITPKTRSLAVRISKENYSDTVVILIPLRDQILSVGLKEKPLNKLNNLYVEEVPFHDSVANRIIQAVIPGEMLINTRNVMMFDRGMAQISLLPWIGTNHRLSGTIINHFSINLLGGYSRGLAGFEAGGIININRENVDGCQISCGFNLSGKDVNGFQASGLMNLNSGNIRGFQLSVVSNLGADTVTGVQAAGLVNVCNLGVKGLQLSPGINISKGHETGVQVAGLINYARNPKFQFGLVNIADTSNGAPLGFINIIKNGYYSLSVSADELQNGYFLFSMGTPKMYSIIGVSGNTNQNDDSWGMHYGLGSHFLYGRRVGINTELLSSIINVFGHFDSTTITRISLSAQLNLKLDSHLSLFAGPSVNTFIADADNPAVDEYISAVLPGSTRHYAPFRTRFDAWVGGSAGLRYHL